VDVWFSTAFSQPGVQYERVLFGDNPEAVWRRGDAAGGRVSPQRTAVVAR